MAVGGTVVKLNSDDESVRIFGSPQDRGMPHCVCMCVSDSMGCVCPSQACADVRAGPVFWQQMEIRDQLSGKPTFPEWLSTHPSHRNRFTQLDRLIPQVQTHTNDSLFSPNNSMGSFFFTSII